MRTRLCFCLFLLFLSTRVADSFFFDDILGLGGNDNENSEESTTATPDGETTPDAGEDTDRRRGMLGSIVSGLTKPLKKPTTIATSILSGNRDLIGNTLQTLFTTVDSCIGSKSGGWTDPDLGDFTTGRDSPYCNRKCYRSFFCCPPQKPEEINVKFIFSAIVNGKARHTQICVSGCKDTQAIINLLKRTDNPITWFVHGLINDIYVEPIYNQTRDALLARGNHVVLVDWHEGNRLYLQSMANVRTVGALLGQLMLHMGAWDRSTCTGFSLGAHICGEAGNYLKKRGKTIRKCEGIDPAGPGFDGCSPSIRLDKNDCGLVTVMHTSAFKNAGSLLFGQGFGTTIKSGHCDFWANDGMDQPKCDNGTVSKLQQRLFAGAFGKFAQDLEWAWECSHYRAVYYYLSQLRHTCDFVGVEGECGGGVACTRSGGANRAGTIEETEDRGRDGTAMTGMRGKRQAHADHFSANVSFPDSMEEETRDKRGLISSGVKGTLNALGLRKKKTKEEKEAEKEEKRRRRKNRRRKDPEEESSGDGDNAPNPFQNDEYGDGGGGGYGYDRPNRGRPGGGGGYGGSGRPDWLEGGTRGDEYGGGGGRPGGGGRGRPPWLQGQGSGGRPNGRPNGGGSNFRPNQGGGGDDNWGEEGGDISSMGGSTGGGNGGNFPRTMSISPDDTCKPSYDLDYKFKTKGTPPFC